ncbi:hypothetical protein A2U01_0109383, partial [Trifolium medium]|nr:hypothetical protein [Trifolium medium]
MLVGRHPLAPSLDWGGWWATVLDTQKIVSHRL